jgi:pyrroline-5-carboxylate reductase
VSEPTIGFVGGGRVVRILLGGWTRAGHTAPHVVVSDTEASVVGRLTAEFPALTAAADNRVASAQEVVFLALHPPAFPAALPEITDSLRPDAIVVSLAPRWTMSKISGMLGGFGRLVRVIPNAPSIVNKGYNPVSFSEQLAPADRQRILSLLAPLGACPEVAEDSLEAYAIVAAMGPTYLWYQLYQLIELGRDFGLTHEAATEAVTAMVDGSAATILRAGLPPEGVIDLIPVKPLAPIEATVKESYASTLRALHAKLKG